MLPRETIWCYYNFERKIVGNSPQLSIEPNCYRSERQYCRGLSVAVMFWPLFTWIVLEAILKPIPRHLEGFQVYRLMVVVMLPILRGKLCPLHSYQSSTNRSAAATAHFICGKKLFARCPWTYPEIPFTFGTHEMWVYKAVCPILYAPVSCLLDLQLDELGLKMIIAPNPFM